MNLDFKKEKFNIAYDMLMDDKHVYLFIYLDYTEICL